MPDRSTNLSHEQKATLLLQYTQDDSRSSELTQIDTDARANHSWGSAEHRKSREEREQHYDDVRKTYQKMSDEELDRAIADHVAKAGSPQ